MSHVGMCPHFMHLYGGFKLQGKTADEALRIIEDGKAIEEAGACGFEIEAVPAPVPTVVLLHGWPQPWYEGRHMIPGARRTTPSLRLTCAASSSCLIRPCVAIPSARCPRHRISATASNGCCVAHARGHDVYQALALEPLQPTPRG
jgi:hypothetical protein